MNIYVRKRRPLGNANVKTAGYETGCIGMARARTAYTVQDERPGTRRAICRTAMPVRRLDRVRDDGKHKSYAECRQQGRRRVQALPT